jgi:hypothetical protein
MLTSHRLAIRTANCIARPEAARQAVLAMRANDEIGTMPFIASKKN